MVCSTRKHADHKLFEVGTEDPADIMVAEGGGFDRPAEEQLRILVREEILQVIEPCIIHIREIRGQGRLEKRRILALRLGGS